MTEKWCQEYIQNSKIERTASFVAGSKTKNVFLKKQSLTTDSKQVMLHIVKWQRKLFQSPVARQTQNVLQCRCNFSIDSKMDSNVADQNMHRTIKKSGIYDPNLETKQPIRSSLQIIILLKYQSWFWSLNV